MSPVPPGPPALDFQATGEVVWADIGGATTPRRASYDGWQVTGPPVSLIRAPDGLWRGTFQGRDAVLAVAPGKISGSGVDISIVRQADGSILVSGSWVGAPVSFSVSKDHIRGSAGANQFDEWLAAPGMYSDNTVGMLKLSGNAARVGEPVMPQLFLALLAVLVQ
jgi:hypothetical protein